MRKITGQCSNLKNMWVSCIMKQRENAKMNAQNVALTN